MEPQRHGEGHPVGNTKILGQCWGPEGRTFKDPPPNSQTKGPGACSRVQGMYSGAELGSCRFMLGGSGRRCWGWWIPGSCSTFLSLGGTVWGGVREGDGGAAGPSKSESQRAAGREKEQGLMWGEWKFLCPQAIWEVMWVIPYPPGLVIGYQGKTDRDNLETSKAEETARQEMVP